MAGYMDEYGVQDARRAKIRNRILLLVLGIAVVSGALYFTFRNYKEEKRVKLFVQELQNKQFQKAYETWGCTADNPCRGYSFEKFMEDWGPQSSHAKAEALKIGSTRSCSEGVIQTIEYPDDTVLLWVNRSDLTLGFAPWPVCNPKIPTPQMQ